MFDVFQKSKRKSPESSNGVVSNPPPLADHHARQSSPPAPPLEVRVAEVIVERNINLSAPSTDAVNATSSDVPVAPSSSAPPPEVVVRPRAAAPTRFAGKSNEEAAAILIQTVFRGYLVCVFALYNSIY